MSTARQTLGRRSELAAEQHLRAKGYRIVDRNVRNRFGELDLVAEHAGVLVFVEVKARRTNAHGGLAYAVGPAKQAKLVRLAAGYLAAHRLGWRPCRFDVVLCSGTEPAAAIEHIENAFEVPGDQRQW